jgi:hypothetical protein
MYGQQQQAQAAVSAANAQAQAAADQAAATRVQAEQQRQAAQASYQNARIQNRKGEQIAEQYNQQQQKLDARRRIAIAQNNAAMGSAGIVSGVGSGLDILGATNEAWEQDSLNLLANQRNATFDNYVQEVNHRNQGNAYTAQAYNTDLQATQYDRLSASYVAQAEQAAKMGQIGVFTTLLSGAASMIGMKGAGGSSASGTEISAGAQVQTPTAASTYARAADTAFGGLTGYAPKTMGNVQGVTGTFGSNIVRTTNQLHKYSGWTGVF